MTSILIGLSTRSPSSQLPPHYSPTRPTSAPPPYRPAASTSLNPHHFETINNTSESTLQTAGSVSPETSTSGGNHRSDTNSTPPSNNPTTLQILTHQPSTPISLPPPIYKCTPSLSPSITCSSSQTLHTKLTRTFTSPAPPSYTPQDPPSTQTETSGFHLNTSSGAYDIEEERSECWCFPSFWATMPSDESQRMEHPSSYVVARQGGGHWSDAGYLQSRGSGRSRNEYGGEVWRAWGGQYAYYIF